MFEQWIFNRESRSKVIELAINQIASNLIAPILFQWAKSRMGTDLFFVSTPFLLVMAAAAAAVDGAGKLLRFG